ncbi:MAG: glycosyltransferase family 1 protein [Moorea sp. SIO3G5]|nr:glycosyltransferase family 1 protein [Moorena sp. SIO3G5]
MIKELRIISGPVSISQFNLNRLGENDPQILTACPNPPPEAVKAGKAIPVPMGEFSIDIILDKLPSDFYPDLVQMSARNMHFMPRGLDKLTCPKVIKIGDTFHWGDGSLSGIIKYCQSFDCDYHWVYQGVQHLHFFVEAGLKNVFWLPGTPVIDHYVPQKKEAKSYDIIFRGSQSSLHVYRSNLLKFLQDNGVKIDISRKPYVESLEDYSKSRIVLNCGLNGDTNRRIFEVIMAGGFLLTDRLSPQSGLFSLFEEGVHLECYDSENELLDKIEFYLKHPEQAEKIAIAGHQKLIDCYSQQAIQQKFYRYILQGEIEPPFRLEHDTRVLHINQPIEEKKFVIRLKIYELIQEIHRLNSRIKLLYWKGRNKELLSDLADLPRLDITYANTTEALADVKTWCSKVEVKDQVQLQSLPLELTGGKQFQMVMVDLPDKLLSIKELLLEIEPQLPESGFLLVVGKATIFTKVMLSILARWSGLLPIRICAANSHHQLGVEACLVYQKLTRPSQAHLVKSTPKLFVPKLSFKAKVSQVLSSLPLVNWTKTLIRNSVLIKN